MWICLILSISYTKKRIVYSPFGDKSWHGSSSRQNCCWTRASVQNQSKKKAKEYELCNIKICFLHISWIMERSRVQTVRFMTQYVCSPMWIDFRWAFVCRVLFARLQIIIIIIMAIIKNGHQSKAPDCIAEIHLNQIFLACSGSSSFEFVLFTIVS
jgi:hypothetical protein